MKTDDLLTCIDNYIKEQESDYAIMLNGLWGCGKTYFVKNALIPHIETTSYAEVSKKVIYVSLYGIKDMDELMTFIGLRILNIKANNYARNKASDYLDRVGKYNTSRKAKALREDLRVRPEKDKMLAYNLGILCNVLDKIVAKLCYMPPE